MRRIHLVAIVVAIAVLFASAVQAQSTPMKFGIVDFRAVMQDSAAAKDVREQIQKFHSDFQKEIEKSEKDLRAAEQDLIAQRGKISPEEFEKKRVEFQNRVGAVQQKVEKRKRALDVAFTQSMEKIQTTAVKLIETIAANQGYTMILQANQVITGEKSLDITGTVMSQLNSQLPKVKVTVNQAE